MADDIERLAMEELLRETKRAKERADVMGAMGWKKGMPTANKTFLANTLVSTLRDYRHLDRDRKQHSSKTSPDKDKTDSKQESEPGRHESRSQSRKHSMDQDKKSEERGQNDRSSRNRRKESPERKHKKRDSIDRKNRNKRTSPERERKDSFSKSLLEDERRDTKRTDRKDTKNKESPESRTKSDKIRKASSDGELSDSHSKELVDSEIFKIDPATIPLPGCKEAATNKDRENDLKQSVSSSNVEEENIKDNILKLPENENDKSDAEQENLIEKEQPNLGIVSEDMYTKNCNGHQLKKSSDLTELKDTQEDIKKCTSVVEMDVDEVHNDMTSVNQGDLNEKITKKKKKTHRNSHSIERSYSDSKSSEKNRKGDKHRKQKKKKSKYEQYDELDKQDVGSNKVKEKDEAGVEENATESDDGLKDKNSDFENEKNLTDKDNKTEDCIEIKDKIIESKDKVDRNEDRKMDINEIEDMNEQRSTDVNGTEDIALNSKRTDSESEKPEKRKRKKEKSGHHHKHKKHKKDHK